MATVETIKDPLGNIFTDTKFDTRTRGVKAEADGYKHGELLHYNDTTGEYERAIVADDSGDTETTADAVVYGGIVANATDGVIIVTGGVRASLLYGYDVDASAVVPFSGLADAEQFRVVGELADKKIIVGDL